MTLATAFEAQVRRSPDAIAVTDESGTVTYRTLDARARQLARLLRGRLAAERCPRVAIVASREVGTVVSILAALKAGASWIPLDLSHPPPRLRAMLADTAAVAVIASIPDAHVRLGVPADQIIAPPPSSPGWPRAEPPSRLDAGALDDEAYVMFTSGSTGQPKGARCTHRGALNLLADVQARRPIGVGHRCSVWTSFSFDVSVYEVFSALLYGGTLCIPPLEVVGSERRFLRWLAANAINSAYVPPFMIDALATLARTRPSDFVLERILVGVEPIRESLLRDLVRGFATCVVLNGYGPTETSICATLYEVPREGELDGITPIGKPVRGATIHLLRPDGTEVPAGERGEIYIAGENVGLGYAGREDLTAERFLVSPESSGATVRYRTGDLGALRADGNLVFCGRLDNQVKIRGHRVECDEVDLALRRHPDVRDSCVRVASIAGSQQLVAYLVASPNAWLTAAGLRAYLEGVLPSFMVPSRYVVLDGLPRGPSGKVCAELLPAPSGERPALEVPYLAPRDDGEAMLVGLWEELLGIRPVGVHDNVFELGADSLTVSLALRRLEDALATEVPVDLVYRCPTVAGTQSAIRRGHGTPAISGGDGDLAGATSEVTPAHVPAAGRADGRPRAQTGGAVLLTGATGFVGAFLLKELLERSDRDVFCLVRPHQGAAEVDRIRLRLARAGLWNDGMARRIRTVRGDLGMARLGLSSVDLDEILASVELVVHNGAWVDQVHSYATLEPANVGATREVVRLATARRAMAVAYISTISVVHSRAHHASGLVPETAPPGPGHCLLNGYGQTKCAAELVVRDAMRHGMAATILRLGTVGGHSETGGCNQDDLFCRDVRACVEMSIAADVDFDVCLVPVDFAARAAVAVALAEEARGRTVHITNPTPFFWSDVVGVISAMGWPVRLVPFREWVEAVDDAARRGRRNPMAALLPLLRATAADGRSRIEQFHSRTPVDCASMRSIVAPLGIQCPDPAELVRRYLGDLSARGLLGRRPIGAR